MVKNRLKADNFEIDSIETTKEVRICWSGKIDVMNPSRILFPYLDDLLDQINGRNVIIDYSKVTFMNSSTFSSILKFLRNCSAKEIHTTVHYDEQVEWQTSLSKAMQTIFILSENVHIVGI